MGKYFFAEDPRKPNLNGLMQICCKEYLKICGHTINIQKSEKDPSKIDIFQGFVFRYRCDENKNAGGKKILLCKMKRGPLKNYINIDEEYNIFSTNFVADQSFSPFQCRGKLIKMPEDGEGGGDADKDKDKDKSGGGGDEHQKQKNHKKAKLALLEKDRTEDISDKDSQGNAPDLASLFLESQKHSQSQIPSQMMPTLNGLPSQGLPNISQGQNPYYPPGLPFMQSQQPQSLQNLPFQNQNAIGTTKVPPNHFPVNVIPQFGPNPQQGFRPNPMQFPPLGPNPFPQQPVFPQSSFPQGPQSMNFSNRARLMKKPEIEPHPHRSHFGSEISSKKQNL